MASPSPLLAFAGKVAALSFGTWYLATTVLADVLPAAVLAHARAAAVLLSLLLLYVDAALLYPNCYSPLRHLPTYRFSGKDIITELPRGKTPLTWFREHGDADLILLRDTLGGSRLFPVSPNALRDIMSTRTYDFEKPWNARAFLARIIGFGLILSEGEAHKKQKKSLTPAFNIRNIRSLYGLMWEKTLVLNAGLEQEMQRTGQVEMCVWSSRLTLDVIGPTALSRDFQSLTTSDHKIADAFNAVLEPSRTMLGFLALNLILPQWVIKPLPMKGNKILDDNCGFLRTLCRSILRENRLQDLKAAGGAGGSGEKTPPTEKDILGHIVQSGEFSEDETIDQMLTMLAAGHETTASALTWTCYLLCQKPHIQAKLRAEIHQTISSSQSTITHDVLESMPYLNGVCEEVLRLFPTVPSTIREAKRQTSIAGTVVPAGTLVVLSIYAVNRNPHFWGPDADEMRPERWIDTAADGTTRPNKHGGTTSNYCEITFLHGPRACIGRDFAKAELRCAIAGIFGRFEVEMVDPNQTITIAGSVTTKPREGMHLRLKTIEGW